MDARLAALAFGRNVKSCKSLGRLSGRRFLSIAENDMSGLDGCPQLSKVSSSVQPPTEQGSFGERQKSSWVERGSRNGAPPFIRQQRPCQFLPFDHPQQVLFLHSLLSY